MQTASKAQYTHNKKFKVLVDKANKACIKKFEKANSTYYNQLIAIIKSIDNTAIACTFCARTTENATTISKYLKIVDRLYKLSDNLKTCYPKRKAVPCTRKPASLCNPTGYSMEKSLKRYAKTLRNENVKKSGGVPKETCAE